MASYTSYSTFSGGTDPVSHRWSSLSTISPRTSRKACKRTCSSWIAPRLLTVNHSLLVHKIHQYGIRGKVHSWIKSCLSGRNQTVVVEGVSSSQVDIDSGIPQGSVLGPSLFIYYINDLQDRYDPLFDYFRTTLSPTSL